MRSTPSHIGKYELRSVLARTATSIVYDGWDSDIARRVAVKAVPLSTLEDSDTREALARFKRGVQAAGQLAHPNVINVYDYGETDDYAYIIMEFVDGPTLKQRLDSGERFDIRSICKMMDGILDGLQYSHDCGVVHRDMKPANIMFTKDRRVKITDFGIARFEDNDMTQAGMVIGTPAYMSPEQFMGEKIDWRSDIYSTGVVLYHMITGARPYDGNLATIMNRVLNSPVPRPSGVSSMATPELDQIVTRAMAKKREQRFQSAAEFNAALQSVSARPEPAHRPVITPRVESPPPARPPRRRAFRPSPALVATVVMILATTGLGITWYLRSAIGSQQARLTAADPGGAVTARPDQMQPVADTTRQSALSQSQSLSDRTQNAPDGNSASDAAAPVDPPPVQPGSYPQMSPAAHGFSDRNGNGDPTPVATLPPPRPTQEFSTSNSQDQSTFFSPPQPPPRAADTPPPKKPNQSGSRQPTASNPQNTGGTRSEQGTDNNRNAKSNSGVTGRPAQENTPLQEVLNRLNNGMPPPSSTPRPGNPATPAPENTLQPPPEYATVTISAVGLVCQTVTSDTAHELGLDAPRGLWCTGVTTGSAAANAGILSNDVLLKINGSEMRDLSRLKKIAAEISPGQTVPVEIFRKGNVRTVQLPVDQLRR
jgi:serine/threonine protein kinase